MAFGSGAARITGRRIEALERAEARVAGLELTVRMRRNRRTDWSRRLVRENVLTVSDLIWPLFLTEGAARREPVASMPGVERVSVDEAVREAERAAGLGIPCLALFPNTDAKLRDERGSEALNAGNLVCRAVSAIKAAVPDLGIMTDVALDPYTSHGHDGLLQDGVILNDETVEVLCAQALLQAQAGADIIAPSDMMDGRVAAIRSELDNEGFENTPIMAYAAKYASAFYGPFRDAADSAPQFGDRRSYQMDPANAREALVETDLDVEEGADIVMVKPALPYLDVLRRVRETTDLPVAAYNVSGEYTMLKSAAQNGWLDEERAVIEALTGIKRAGADIIITYHAPDAAQWMST
jgi:porphobilinogen synthase